MKGQIDVPLITTEPVAGVQNVTNDYEKLKNIPTINGVEIKGQLTDEDLNIKIPEIDLTDYALKNEIPTKLSELINDSKFIDKETNELANYDTKEQVDNKIEEKIPTLDPISNEKINQLFCDHSNISVIARPANENSCSYQDKVCKDCNKVIETTYPTNHDWADIGSGQMCTICGATKEE